MPRLAITMGVGTIWNRVAACFWHLARKAMAVRDTVEKAITSQVTASAYNTVVIGIFDEGRKLLAA
ncbi:MAG: hypothetical protein U0894_00745 [Pirellulales bacterium]